MNVSEMAMALAAGISIHAALTHGLVGLSRRPRDRVRLAFAVEALAVAAGALAVVGMYSAATPEAHTAAMKWVFYPAGVVWAVSTLWMVAFFTGVRPMRWLIGLSTGFGIVLIVNFVLPFGLLHVELGSVETLEVEGSGISMIEAPAPHPLNYADDILLVASFAFMFYAAWRFYQRGERRRALAMGIVVFLFALATLVDTLTDYGVLTSLYLTQLSFVAVALVVSILLRRESLEAEAELRVYKTRLESLIDERVKELDHANEQLGLEIQDRLSAEETLRRRVAELDALQRISQTLSHRRDLATALDQVAPEIADLLAARYARVDLSGDDVPPLAASDIGAGPEAELLSGGAPPVDADAAIREISRPGPAAFEGPGWAGLPADLRDRVTHEGTQHLLVVRLVARGEAVGILSLARDRGQAFSDEEGRLAQTVAEDLAAAIENERLHLRQTRQVAEEERQRLARDLHDAVTQTIYSATLIAEALPAVWERDPSEGLHNLVRLRRLVRAALAEMRTLLFELRPSALAAAPLDSLLARLADALAGQIQVSVDVRVPEGMVLPPQVKLAFYRVAQEAFSNIVKHAHAAAVEVAVRVGEDGSVTLTIRDDGRGFDPDAVSQSRMGLLIMRERLNEVGAAFALDSRPGAGTTIDVSWPGAELQTAAVGREGREQIAEHPRDDRR